MARAAARDSGHDQSESIRGRLGRAFSLRRNLRQLFVPAEGHLRPLDGLRAISILWVVVFHAGWYLWQHVPVKVYGALVFSHWMLPIWRGDFGVDIFFVISGFLIAGILIDERESTGRLRLALFYARRLMRLWPALAVAALVDLMVTGVHPEMLWANLLYVSNFIPVLQTAMAWTWSLAIEEQFYLVCPLLVSALASRRGRTRAAVIAGVALALCGVVAWVVLAGDFHAIDSEVVISRDIPRWARGFDHLYVKPWMRAGPLLSGVAAAYLFRQPGLMDALGRGRALPVLGLVLALGAAVASTHWPLVHGAPRGVEVAFLALYRNVFGASIAYVLLLSISRQPVGVALGRLLSSRLLYPFSQLAYTAYLLNPLVTNAVDRALAPLVLRWKAAPLPLFLPFDMVVTFLAAALLHLFIERPFMELRPRSS